MVNTNELCTKALRGIMIQNMYHTWGRV